MKSLSAITVYLAALILFAAPASATVITSSMLFDFSGPTQSTDPLVMTFDDGGIAGSVTLTIDYSAASNGEKVSDVYFNFNGDPSTLLFAFVGGSSTGPAAMSIGQTTDSFKADGSGFFDIQMAWSTANNPPTLFSAGEVVVYTITGLGITANDFLSFSTASNKGTFCTAAHVQSLSGGQSDFIGGDCTSTPPPPPPGIPEPGTLALIATGLAGVGALGRRRRRPR